MTAEQCFSVANLMALVAWLPLLAVPGHRWTKRISGTLVPLAFAIAYLVLFALHWADGNGSFSTLQGVADLFANRWLLLAGWVHYLAFDLFVGTWEASDAMARGVSRWVLTPCLILTFLFGPIGFLIYHVVAAVPRRHRMVPVLHSW